MSASWINKLNESDSRLHKEDVLKQALEATVLGSTNAQVFLGFLKACYNPYVTFGVKQIPDTVGIINAENPWSQFNDLLLDLSYRKLTGHAARDAIQEMAERFNSEEWNVFCAPVLRRDMRAGISSTTINKIVKKTEYEIPIFGCQLATNSEGRPEMKGTKRLEPKLDGVRALFVVIPSDDGEVTIICYSRNGKQFDNFSHIEEQIRDNYTTIVRACVGADQGRSLINGFVLDGEVIGNTFQELMRQARRKSDVQAGDSVFNIFDIVPLEDFRRGHWNAQLRKRIALLDNMRAVIHNMPNVELLPHIMVDLDTAAGKDQLERYARDNVNAGFEGIMIKNMEAPYQCKRSTDWMKWKPTITVDLEVVGVEEGTGRNVGRLGALVCAGVDDGKEISVNVGSGFSDTDRDDYWLNRNVVIGRTAEVLCDVITQNQDGTYSLRFPRFVRFRDDKSI
jgi:DNA ligase-1